MKLNIEVDIPVEVFDKISGRKVWKGKLTCTVNSLSNGRKDLIDVKVKKAQAKAYYQLGNDERKIFDRWNKNPYLEALVKDRSSGESRNFPITLENFLENKRIYKLAIERVGVGRIIQLMDSYFDACKNDEHIWDSLNHAFKNLIGFLSKVSRAEKRKEKLWWERSADKKIFEDSHPVLTKEVADSFAQMFLGMDTYDLINPSRDYRSFLKVGNNIEDFLSKNEVLPFSKFDLITYVLKAAKRHADEVDLNILYPGTLTTRTLWKIVIPQFLNEVQPGYDFKW